MAFLRRRKSVGRIGEKNRQKKKSHTDRDSGPSHGKSGLLKARGQQKKKLCRHMVDIWNETVQCKLYAEDMIFLTPQREGRLIQFLEEVLGPERSWEDYCYFLSNHDFLGQVTLDWALIPQTSHMVFLKSYDPKNNRDVPWIRFYEEIKIRHHGTPYAPEWFQIGQHLAKRLGQRVYRIWFEDARIVTMGEKTITIQAGSAFKCDYILTYFFLDVVYAVQAAYPPMNQVKIKK